MKLCKRAFAYIIIPMKDSIEIMTEKYEDMNNCLVH